MLLVKYGEYTERVEVSTAEMLSVCGTIAGRTIVRRLNTMRAVHRQMKVLNPQREMVKRNTLQSFARRNRIIGACVFGWAAAVYGFTIWAIKQEDFSEFDK